jgi:transcriptional regulator with XRE-family HTH domain
MDEHTKALTAHVGRNLNRLIAAKGVTVEELAESSSVDRELIEQLLRGEGDLLVDALALLAGALGVRPEMLMDGIAWVPDKDGRGGEYRIEGSTGD